jgi:hypothetical protein
MTQNLEKLLNGPKDGNRNFEAIAKELIQHYRIKK